MMQASDSSLSIAEKSAVTLRRQFHLPTGLEPGDRVLLVLRWESPFVSAQLNGTDLQIEVRSDGSHQTDVTRQLTARNELAINLAPPSPAPLDSREPILEATLQIHPS